MKIVGHLVTPVFDLPKYRARLDASLTEQLHQGIQIWLAAVTGRVPLWSGMARASLLGISRLVNGKIILAPLQAKSRIPQGEALGSASVTANFPRYTFEVTIDVEHYVIQEDTNVRGLTGRGSPSAPWKSFDAGREAFTQFTKTINIPPITLSSKVVRIN